MPKASSGNYKAVNIGTSLILVVFIILTLVTFAALSAVAAASDYNASQTALKRTHNYYSACVLGEEQLSKIHNILKDDLKSGSGNFTNAAKAELEKIDVEILSWEVNSYTCTYTVPIDETQVLYVKLALNSKAKPLYTKEVWEKRAKQAWQGDNSVTLLQ